MKNYWSLKSSKKAILFTFFLFSAVTSYGQLEESHIYKENYYLFPINPGIRNSLAGTMGELRSSHFHAGIDIRTDGKIGLPVYAAADGYIFRVAVSTSGYGNAVYIMHPNGKTTVYAHLDRFFGELADRVRQEQYSGQTFGLNLFFEKEEFEVKRGDTIAFAGNSGSSGGPHLHFDLRDEYQRPLNPLKYGFEEIWDRTAPEAHKIALKTMDKNSRVNGRFGRFEFEVKRIGNKYVIDQPIEVYGNIGAELYAYDKLDDSHFKCGINLITMEVDDREVFRQEINSFAFSEQRNILRHMNYRDLHNSGERFHKLYIDDGNKLNFYNTNDNKGKLSLTGNGEHTVDISMTDSYHNTSYLTFKLKSSDTYTEKVITTSDPEESIDLIDNTLVIKAPYHEDSVTAVYCPDMHKLSPAYIVNNQMAVYLWDMKKGLPHSVDVNGKNEILDYKDMIPSSGAYTYYNDKMDVFFPKQALFDTLYLKVDYKFTGADSTEQFILGDERIPLRKYISVTLKPQISYQDPQTYSVYALDGHGNAYYKGGKWEHGRVNFSTRDFGRFTILQDTTPPEVTPVVINKDELQFKIRDGISGINDFKCFVNNEWVLMNYDYKRELIWSEKLDPQKPFSGPIKLLVKDNQGNVNVYETVLSD